MKKIPKKNNQTENLIIKIAPADWQVSDPVKVKICQQPAKIFPWPRLPSQELPRLDVWQLDELFPAPNQQIF